MSYDDFLKTFIEENKDKVERNAKKCEKLLNLL